MNAIAEALGKVTAGPAVEIAGLTMVPLLTTEEREPGYATLDEALASDVFKFIRRRLASYKRVRRIEFSDLPKTISGKIRRVQLRALERERRARGERGPLEFWQEEFPELKT